MKKEYIEPQLKVFVLRTIGLIASSGKGVYGSLSPSGEGVSPAILEYGGIDETGELDPD